MSQPAVKGRLKNRLITRLIGFYLVPVALAISISALSLYLLVRRGYEQELGLRLEALAHMTAVAIGPALAYVPEGDGGSTNYENLRRRLGEIREANGVERIMIFTPDFRARLDTDPQLRPGERLYHAEQDRSEIDLARQEGRAAASLLFKGRDGRYFKSAYAPVAADPRAVVGVMASADFFDSLRELQAGLFRLALAGVVAIVVVSFLFSRGLLRPVNQLVEDARRIGQGRLDAPVHVSSGDEIGLLARTMEEMRQGLQERDRNMQMMLQGIAHEIRNPLGGIELFAGLLKKQLAAGDPKLAGYVEKIQTENANLKRLVDDFLAFSRHIPPQPAPFPAGRLAADLREAFQSEMESRRIEWKFEGNPNAEIVADYNQMRRVFLNLVRNAIQAVGEDGQVTLALARANGTLSASVRDTGPGMPEEQIASAFAPFFTTKEQGSGLGLAFSRKIVEGHHGTIHLRNRPEGGAEVALEIPQPAGG